MTMFAEFWAAYPRKVAKVVAERRFKTLNPSPELFAEMLRVLELHTRDWTDVKYTPHPATWLSQRRWEDSAPAVKPALGSLARPRWYDDCTHVPMCANRAEHELRAAKMEAGS